MVVRAKMILFASQGLSNDQIAAKVDARREVVFLLRKRFFEQWLEGLEERSRPGRPRAFPTELVVQIKAIACASAAEYKIPIFNGKLLEPMISLRLQPFRNVSLASSTIMRR
jgi:transposase